MDLHRKALVIAPTIVCLFSAAHLASLFAYRARRRRRHLPPTEPGESRAAPSSSPPPSALTSLEASALVVDVIVAALLLAFAPPPAQAQLLVVILSSAYALCLVCFASFSAASSTLRRHLMAIYALQWLIAFVVARHHLSAAPLMRLPVFTILLLLRACASRQLDDASASEKASLASRMTLSWITALLWKGYRTSLESHHLHDVAHSPNVAQLASSFRQTTVATLPLPQRLFAFFNKDLTHQAFWAAISGLTLFIPVNLLYAILLRVESSTASDAAGYLLIGGLLLCGLVSGVANAQREWSGQKIAVKIKAILTSQIYVKTLRQKRLAGRPASENDVVTNLITVDAAIVAEVGAHLHLLWLTVPLHVLAASCTLYRVVGPSGIVGLAIIIIALLPLRCHFSRRHAYAHREALRAAASRAELATDIFSNLRIIKLYAWVAEFENRIGKPRRTELDRLRHKSAWLSAYTTACGVAPLLAAAVTFFSHTVVAGHQLASSVAFPTLVAFALLHTSLDRAADMASFVPQASVCIASIENFLAEWEPDCHPKPLPTPDECIGFDGATLEWSGPEHVADEHVPLVTFQRRPSPFRLHGLHIRFLPQGLNVIFGPKGSGKSSLLLALLGEMDLVNGRLHQPLTSRRSEWPSRPSGDPFSLYPMAAYCPSPPWIQNKTIRDNITFGLPFDYTRYKDALEAVDLLPQLPTLWRGDLTIAGDKGARLSADQRRRVALARALYSRAQYLLVEDCFDGLDHTAAKVLFVGVFKGPLMRGRTCILTVQQHEPIIAHCDYAVYLSDGKISHQGCPVQLVTARVLPAEVLVRADSWTPKSLAHHKQRRDEDNGFDFRNFSKAPTMFEREAQARRAPEEPERASWSAIRLYLDSMGSSRFRLMVICAFLAQQVACLVPSLWITQWTRQSDSLGIGQLYQMTILGVAVVAYGLILFVREAMVSRGALEASRALHQRLMASILRAQFDFLYRHSTSSLTATYLRDMQLLDQDVGSSCSGIMHLVISLVVSLTLISTMLPVFLLVAAPAGLVCAAAGSLYARFSAQLSRLSTSGQSALLQHLQETMSGNVSIRAYGQVAAFVSQAHDLADRDARDQLLRCAAQEWLVFRVACVGAAVSSATGALMFWSRSGSLEAGTTGLALLLAMSLDEHVLMLIRKLSQGRRCFDAVARIRQIMGVEPEPAQPIKESRGPSYSWPQRGSIRFRNYSARYESDQKYALQHVDLNIQGGYRVAVVGERGSGKSSLAMAMVRRIEAADGAIELDGVNMATLQLDELRKLVTVVPQDPNPALFRGTLRETLDPLLDHSEEQISDVAQSLHLYDALSTGLDDTIPVLSPGQRQLLCVARALLHRSLVIIIDEATDNMDETCDSTVQTALRDGIAAGTTVITIANRLVSIADYDRVIVLAGGRVVEEDITERLLDKDEKTDKSAFFKHMCRKTGQLAQIEWQAGLRTLWTLSLYDVPLGIWTRERGNRILEMHNWSPYRYDLSGIL
ncbi:hypothetical protein L249_0745 [Ophiocordyceps polyrhachis-furcata BCC 54312]|uniref:Uncharacterized protein n=1 Tax=Ophiocordyceps polyrhachis-furcata BCC 54312 TaxID=1330021 RepID=A0A367LD02_9HYPO|nr:hypothetical protein L249_0745 [Ophiocordyceps polyrhachis-furcata BCC 54312]